MTTCKLCREVRPLRRSHISPQFITDWLRKSSLTGKLRGILKPNLRLQDTFKEKMLCDDCEGLFSRYEKQFAEKIFKPVLDSYMPSVIPDEAILNFIISLSWRALILDMGKDVWKSETHQAAAHKAEENWREYLLGKKTLQINQHHMMMLRLMEGAPVIAGTDVDINWYFFRGVDMTVGQSHEEAFLYVKVPGLAFFSSFYERPFSLLTGTRIVPGKLIHFFQQNADSEVFNFLRVRAYETLTPFSKMSSRQKAKINQDWLKNTKKGLHPLVGAILRSR